LFIYRRPNWTTNSSISGNGTTVSREVAQSVPADYGQWLVHSLLPQREYVREQIMDIIIDCFLLFKFCA
jgi:hypothetical protein